MSSALRDPQDEQAMAMGLLSLVAVPRLKAGAEIDRERMRREELVLLDLVDGKRSVAAILQEGRLSGFVAMRILRSLYLRNILEPSDAQEAAAAAPSPAAAAPVVTAAEVSHTTPMGGAAAAAAFGEAAARAGGPAEESERGGRRKAERTLAVDTREAARAAEERRAEKANERASRRGKGRSEPPAGNESAGRDAPFPEPASAPSANGPAKLTVVATERPTRAKADADVDGSDREGDAAAPVPVESAKPGESLRLVTALSDDPAAEAAPDLSGAVAKDKAEGAPPVRLPAAVGDSSERTEVAAPPPSAAHDAGESTASRGGTPRPFLVGPYEVAARIAQGGMGSVYVCRRRGPWGFERLFTLKVVRQHAAVAEEALRSFLREAKLGASLSHPNLLGVLDAGSFDGHPYLILDYVEGTNFAELLSAGRPAPELVVTVVLDLLAGLGALHAQTGRDGTPMSLVHGDVSPENLIVGLDGSARLGDFGSARSSGASPETAQAVAKPAFMAPEQLCGEPVDARTDIFSVGVLLWTALTGQKLFGEATYEKTVMNVLRKKIPPPSSLGAPAALDEICMRALARGPDGRYASAEEMRASLLKVASAAGLVATPGAIGAWVRRVAGDALDERRRRVAKALAAEPAARAQLTPAPSVEPVKQIAVRRRASRPTVELRSATQILKVPHTETVDEELPVLARGDRWRRMWVVALVLATGLGALAWAAWRSVAVDVPRGGEPPAAGAGPQR